MAATGTQTWNIPLPSGTQTLCCLLLMAMVSYSHGFIHIEDQLQNVEVMEGQRAKFVCRVKVHPLDEGRLQVRWKHNGEFLDLDLHNTESGRHVYKAERNRHALIVKDTRLNDTGVYTCVAAVGLDLDMSTAHLQVKGPPGPPQDVRLVSCRGATAQLQWRQGPDHGATIIRYTVQFNTSHTPDRWHDYYDHFLPASRQLPRRARQRHSPTETRDLVRYDGTTSATLHLSHWVTYSFRVKAVTELGVSKPSHVTRSTCSTPPDRPDTNPKNVRTRTDVKHTLVIEWTPMDRLQMHGPSFRYRVLWRRRGRLAWKSATVTDAAASSFQRDVSDVYGLYEVQVKAVNNVGPSHQPAFVYLGRSGEAEPVVMPKDFRLNPSQAILPHRAFFIWEAVNTSLSLVRGHFRGYKLCYWKSAEGRHKRKEVDLMVEAGQDRGPDMRVSVSDLPAYTALRATVAVLNTHYSGPPSHTIDFFTPEGPPGAVCELHVQAYGVGYVLLQWRPPQRNNGVLRGYHIAYQHMAGRKVGRLRDLARQINTPATLGARISGLKPDHQYRFYVWARTAAGRGHAAYTDIRTRQGKLPQSPRQVGATVVRSSVNVTWQPHSAPGILYLLQYRQQGSQEWRSTDHVSNTSWVLLDRADPVLHCDVRVLARNQVGDTATSSILRFSGPAPGKGDRYTVRLDGRQEHDGNAAERQTTDCWLLAVCVMLHVVMTWSAGDDAH